MPMLLTVQLQAMRVAMPGIVSTIAVAVLTVLVVLVVLVLLAVISSVRRLFPKEKKWSLEPARRLQAKQCR